MITFKGSFSTSDVKVEKSHTSNMHQSHHNHHQREYIEQTGTNSLQLWLSRRQKPAKLMRSSPPTAIDPSKEETTRRCCMLKVHLISCNFLLFQNMSQNGCLVLCLALAVSPNKSSLPKLCRARNPVEKIPGGRAKAQG